MLKFNKTSKEQVVSVVKDMADRLDEIDGLYSWVQDADCVLDYVEQQAARITELEHILTNYSRGGLTGVVWE